MVEEKVKIDEMFVCLNESCCNIWVGWWIDVDFDSNEWDSNNCGLKWYIFNYSFNIKFLSGLGFFLRNIVSLGG